MLGIALSLSIAGLLLGPAILSWARSRGAVLRVLDAAMLGIVLPLLLLRMIPHLVEEIGLSAIAAMGAGYAAFFVMESRSQARSAQLGVAILLPALATHSLLDGAALAIALEHRTADPSGSTLGIALVLHRVPEGIALASTLMPAVGLRGTMLRTSALAAMTIVGALLGNKLLVHISDHALHVVVAVGLGVMVRMILHPHGKTSLMRGDPEP